MVVTNEMTLGGLGIGNCTSKLPFLQTALANQRADLPKNTTAILQLQLNKLIPPDCAPHISLQTSQQTPSYLIAPKDRESHSHRTGIVGFRIRDRKEHRLQGSNPTFLSCPTNGTRRNLEHGSSLPITRKRQNKEQFLLPLNPACNAVSIILLYLSMAIPAETLSLEHFLRPLEIDIGKIHGLARGLATTYVKLARESKDQFLSTPISDSVLRPVRDAGGR